MPKTVPSPELDEQIISLYTSGKTSYFIANKFGCAQSFVINRLKKHNIERRHIFQRYITNEKFFEAINDEASAYFLGLMYADGNNYVKRRGNYEVRISLQIEDQIILEKFRDLISPTTKLKFRKRARLHWKDQIALIINNKKLSEQLTKLGCIPNKSLKLTFPDFIPSHLVHHFIRGYSDGDGSIYTKKHDNNHAWQITSTVNFCQSVKKIIKNLLDIHCSIAKISKDEINQITTTLSIGGNLQVKRILNWLYQGATIYLPRKYERYQNIINPSHLQMKDENPPALLPLQEGYLVR